MADTKNAETVKKGEATKPVDADAALHRTQLIRVGNLLDKVNVTYKQSVYVAKSLWWACHLAALIGWASGLSIAGVFASGSQVGQIAGSFLGGLAMIYPLLKYVNLEDKRKSAQDMVKFCSNLKDRLEDVKSQMEGILGDGFDSSTEQNKWAEFMIFVGATKKFVEALDLGVDNVQKDFKEFESLELKLQRDAAGMPHLAAPAYGAMDTVATKPVVTSATKNATAAS